MSDRDFEADGRKFKLNKIDAFKQFHILRRMGPILGDIVPVISKLSKVKTKNLSEEQSLELMAKVAGPFMIGISKLSDESANHVLLGLCSAVEMQQEQGNWAKVATDEVLMFQDLSLKTLLTVAGRSFAYNMQSFFALAPQASRGTQ